MTRLNKLATVGNETKQSYTCERKRKQQTISISVRQAAYNSTPPFIYLTDDGVRHANFRAGLETT